MFRIKAKKVLICQNDALGDVVLTIPLCNILKASKPEVEIYFLGRPYTKPVIEMCQSVDHFLDHDQIHALPEPERVALFKKLGIDTALLLRSESGLAKLIKSVHIKYRIGYVRYLPHILNCNRFVTYSKTKINLHQGQSRIKFLAHFGIKQVPNLAEFPDWYGTPKTQPLAEEYSQLLDSQKLNIILHPGTSGNAPQWENEKYIELIEKLRQTGKYKIFVSGSPKENEFIAPWNIWEENVVNIAGKLPLDQFLSFIQNTDGLIAGSTGPVHMAAMLGINTLGLYPGAPRFKKAENWAPIGYHASYLESEDETMTSITVADVLSKVLEWHKRR